MGRIQYSGTLFLLILRSRCEEFHLHAFEKDHSLSLSVIENQARALEKEKMCLVQLENPLSLLTVFM